MAIIKTRNNSNKKLIKIKVSEQVLSQIEKYCEWSGIFDIGYFVEEAAEYIFRKDLDWKQFKKEKANTEILK